MNLRKFEEFINSGIVKIQAPNNQRSLALIKGAEEKKSFLSVSIKNIPRKQMNANFIVDYSYDILMELIRAKMFIDGYNVGNSHEAEVSYLEKLRFSEFERRFMNEIRYYRNGTKYYGTMLDNDYADKVLSFLEKIYPRLKKLLDQKKP